MKAEVANVVDAVSGMASAVSSMARSVDFLEVSLRDLRHEIEGRGNLVDETAERVRAVKRMVFGDRPLMKPSALPVLPAVAMSALIDRIFP